jgi:hypothetical protein
MDEYRWHESILAQDFLLARLEFSAQNAQRTDLGAGWRRKRFMGPDGADSSVRRT